MRSLKDNRVPFIITQPEPYRGYTILDIQYWIYRGYTDTGYTRGIQILDIQGVYRYWIYRGYTDTGYTGCMRILDIYCVLIKLKRYPFV